MNTAIAVQEPRALATASPWSAWDEKMRFAKELVGTGFCPSAIKTPAQALAVILTGQELGIPPMHALRSIHIIQGKPTLSAELMMALMLKGGVTLGWGASNDTAATLSATRGQTAFTGSFTLEEAKRAGLTNKDGWRNYPAAMLRARVIALVARVVAPDLISGLYTAEELGVDVDAEGAVVSVPVVMQSAPVASVAEPIDVSAGEVVEDTSEPAPFEEWGQAIDAASAKSLRAIWTACNKPDVWSRFTLDQQTALIDKKNDRKKDLGLE